ncbi:MAG: DUF5691 domain-containing protein [Cyanobacteria bacterium P01_E01_bin.48]
MISSWKAVLNTALVGTARQPFAVPTDDGQLGQVLAGLDSESSEANLLGAAAAIALHQRIGQLPTAIDLDMTEPCPAEEGKLCNAEAAKYLERLLGGEHQTCLSEWLDLAIARGQRVPEFYLPDLLDVGRRRSELRGAIAAGLGARGRWLAEQNPAWHYAAVGVEDDFVEKWEIGTISSRLATLTTWRSRAPEAARLALEETWMQDAAGDRAKFLSALNVGLSLDDELFLEAALGDRSKQVRQVAARLLADLPHSQLSQRMTERAATWLSLADGKLVVSFPDSLSTELQADGVQEQTSGRGKKAHWFYQVVSRVPPQHWTECFSLSPAELIELAQQTDWFELLLRSWTDATRRYGDRPWAETLLAWLGDDIVGHVVAQCFEVLPTSQREAIAIAALQHATGDTQQLVLERVILACQHPWSESWARVAIAACRQSFTREKQRYYVWEQLLMACAQYYPPALVEEAMAGWTAEAETYWERLRIKFRDRLEFRRAMTNAFHADC